MFKQSLIFAATTLASAAQTNTSSASSDSADTYGPDQQVFYAGIAITGFVFLLAGGLAVHSQKEKIIKSCFRLFKGENNSYEHAQLQQVVTYTPREI